VPLPATCSRRLSTCLHIARGPTKTQTANPSLPNTMGSALPPPHRRPATLRRITATESPTKKACNGISNKICQGDMAH
jgi:hypothetical protein